MSERRSGRSVRRRWEHVFVRREWLQNQLDAGRSYEQIAELCGSHASTISYWARKYGLSSPYAHRHSARGAPDRRTLERLAAEGATLQQMAATVDRSVSTVRYWLERWEIPRTRRGLRVPVNQASAPRVTQMECRTHGLTRFVLEGRGYYRCGRCRQEGVVEWRRRTKRRLVEEAGGCCRLCGYDRSYAALQFHHLDRSKKEFALSLKGVARSIARVRAEAAKCVLLCANDHAEVEAGVRTVTAA